MSTVSTDELGRWEDEGGAILPAHPRSQWTAADWADHDQHMAGAWDARVASGSEARR